MLSCITPHVGEEMWQILGHDDTIAYEPWPAYDEEKCKDTESEIAVQINGKIKGKLMVPATMTKQEGESTLVNDDRVKALIGDKTIMKIIFVPGRLLNLVVK